MPFAPSSFLFLIYLHKHDLVRTFIEESYIMGRKKLHCVDSSWHEQIDTFQCFFGFGVLQGFNSVISACETGANWQLGGALLDLIATARLSSDVIRRLTSKPGKTFQ